MSQLRKLFDFSKVYYAVINSAKGLVLAAQKERAFFQELILTIILAPAAVIMNVSVDRKVLLIGSLLAVLVVELLNSAIEGVVDYISKDYNELAGRIKDMASAAVFLSFFVAVLVWGWTIIELI